eukprot:6858779-Prymnesium_polylepis.2
MRGAQLDVERRIVERIMGAVPIAARAVCAVAGTARNSNAVNVRVRRLCQSVMFDAGQMRGLCRASARSPKASGSYLSGLGQCSRGRTRSARLPGADV